MRTLNRCIFNREPLSQSRISALPKTTVDQEEEEKSFVDTMNGYVRLPAYAVYSLKNLLYGHDDTFIDYFLNSTT